MRFERTNAEIVSVIRGETSEEVQIKENLGTIENGYRILFVNDVVNNYKNGKSVEDFTNGLGFEIEGAEENNLYV